MSSLFNKKKPETIRELCKLIDVINKKINSPEKKPHNSSISISILCISCRRIRLIIDVIICI